MLTMKGPCGVRYRDSDGKRDKTPALPKKRCLLQQRRARKREIKRSATGNDLESV